MAGEKFLSWRFMNAKNMELQTVKLLNTRSSSLKLKDHRLYQKYTFYSPEPTPSGFQSSTSTVSSSSAKRENLKSCEPSVTLSGVEGTSKQPYLKRSGELKYLPEALCYDETLLLSYGEPNETAALISGCSCWWSWLRLSIGFSSYFTFYHLLASLPSSSSSSSSSSSVLSDRSSRRRHSSAHESSHWLQFDSPALRGADGVEPAARDFFFFLNQKTFASVERGEWKEKESIHEHNIYSSYIVFRMCLQERERERECITKWPLTSTHRASVNGLPPETRGVKTSENTEPSPGRNIFSSDAGDAECSAPKSLSVDVARSGLLFSFRGGSLGARRVFPLWADSRLALITRGSGTAGRTWS